MLCNKKMLMTHGNACTCKVAVRHLLFASRDQQGSSQSGGMRGWGSCGVHNSITWMVKEDILSETWGAKSHLQSCMWEKLGLLSNILSILAAFHSFFPLVR